MTGITTPGALPEERTGLWLALRVFDEPGAVFDSLARRPRAMVPVLLILVVTLAGSALTPASILQKLGEQQVQAIERQAPGRLTPERRQAFIQGASSFGNRSLLFVSIAGGTLILLLLAALILQGAFSLGGAELTFRDEFAIVTHSYLPQLAGYLLVLALLPLTSDPQLALGLGFLFDPAESPFLHRFASSFTVFVLWQVYLLALGNQIKTKSRGIGGPLAIVLALWTVAALGLAALGGLAGGAAR